MQEFTDFIKDHLWPIFLYIGGIFAAMWRFCYVVNARSERNQERLNAHEKRFEKLESKVEKLEEMKSQIVSLEKTVEYVFSDIKTSLEAIEQFHLRKNHDEDSDHRG